MREYTSITAIDIILFLVFFMSNISQIPMFIENGLSRYIAISSFLFLFLFIIFKKLIKLDKKTIPILFLWMYFVLFNLIKQILLSGQHITSTFVYPFTLSIFIFFIGNFLAPIVNKRNFKIGAIGYIISGLIVTFAVYLDSFSNGFSWSDRGYAYVSKNSVSQIILTTIIFLLIYIKPKRKILLLIKWGSIGLTILQLLMLKSRASILGLFIVVIIIVIYGREHQKTRNFILLIIILLTFYLFLNNNAYDFIFENIILSGRDVENLNDLSSGRWEMFIAFPEVFFENPLIGHGTYYIESFPLSIFAHYGVIGGLPLLLIALIPLHYIIFKIKFYDDFNICFFMIVTTYLFNGVFEQQAPFGPGVKCYILWLMFGLLFKWNYIFTYKTKG